MGCEGDVEKLDVREREGRGGEEEEEEGSERREDGIQFWKEGRKKRGCILVELFPLNVN